MKINGVKVLILETEDAVSSVFEEVCSKFDANCKVVTDTSQFRVEIPRFRPQMVILGDSIGLEAGLKLVKDLRNYAPTAYLPIYGVMGENSQSVRGQWLNAGADNCFYKRQEVQALQYEIYSCLFHASKVYHLTRENRQIKESHKGAEVANAAKTKFLANMSHDIRTPISGVIGMTSFLMETDLCLEQKNFVENIRTSGEVALSLLEDILDFSKIESDNLELLEQPFNLTRCYEEALDAVLPRAAEKDLNVNFSMAPEVREVVIGDNKRIRQVLTNLIGNAIKFTSKGDIKVSVLKNGEKNGKSLLQFSVRDTGIGIDKDQLDDLFEYFRQASVFIGNQYGGYGLGLAICKGLIKLMDGTIWVESEPGQGTTFKFEIPLETNVTSEASANLDNVRILGNTAEISGKSVLLLDSFKPKRHILDNYFQSWGLDIAHQDSLAAIKAEITGSGTPSYDFLFLHAAEVNQEMDETIRAISEHVDAQSLKTRIIVSVPYQLTWEKVRNHNSRNVTFLPRPLKYSMVKHTLIGLMQGKCQTVDPEKSANGAECQPTEFLPSSDGSEIQNQNQPFGTKLTLSMDKKDTSPSNKKEEPAKLADRLPMSILLVDDNHINLRVAGQLVKQLGYEHFETAENGQEAIDKCAEMHFDFILMDVQMPIVDGLEATRQIRDQELIQGKQASKIVAMTANVMADDRSNCLNAGMDEYLSKPIRNNTLRQTIETLFFGASSSSEVAPASTGFESNSAPRSFTGGNAGVRGSAVEEASSGSLQDQFEDQFAQFDNSLEGTGALESLDKAHEGQSSVLERNSSVVDIAHLEEISGKDTEIMRDIANQYLKDATTRSGQLKTAIKLSDFEKAKRICHNFAGASATCGVIGVEKLLRDMETMCKNRHVPNQDQLYQLLEEEIAKVGSYFLANKLMFA